MFKNLMIYRIGLDWPTSAESLEAALAAEPFAECSATQQRSTGWVPPRGEDHGALVEVVDGQWIARFVIETKSVPGDAVREHAEAAAASIEKTTGRRPGTKEMRDLRDDALQALLPHAFRKRKPVWAWIDPERGLLAIDATTQSAADELISSLVRVADKGFEVRLLHTVQSPLSVMTEWLATDSPESLPEAFHVERECELKASGDEPAVVKFSRHDLANDEIRQHIAEGKLPTKLALGWQRRVAFTLTLALQLKKITFQEGVFEKQPKDKDADRFDADVALATGELGALIDDLIEALGGEEKAIA